MLEELLLSFLPPASSSAKFRSPPCSVESAPHVSETTGIKDCTIIKEKKLNAVGANSPVHGLTSSNINGEAYLENNILRCKSHNRLEELLLSLLPPASSSPEFRSPPCSVGSTWHVSEMTESKNCSIIKEKSQVLTRRSSVKVAGSNSSAYCLTPSNTKDAENVVSLCPVKSLCSNTLSQPVSTANNILLQMNTSNPSAAPMSRNICKECGKSFSSSKYLYMHLRRKHKSTEKNSCCFCEKQFAHMRRLKVHYRIHTGEKPYTCEVCNKAFRIRSSLTAHQERQSCNDRENQSCDIPVARDKSDEDCASNAGDSTATDSGDSEASFKQDKSMDELLKPLLKFMKNLKCELCGFESKANLKRSRKGSVKVHLLSHLTEKNFKCNICGKLYTSPKSLSHHKSTHSKGASSSLSCNACGKIVSSKKYLYTHQRRKHRSEEKYSCSICEKQFSYSWSLKTHYRIHTGEKPYVCSVCNKAFRTRGPLRIHLLSHSDEKMFSCKLCDKAYNNKVMLKQHMNTHKDSPAFKCSVCEKSFNYRTNLMQHMLVHSNARRHTCETCGMKFKLPHHLRNHIETHL